MGHGHRTGLLPWWPPSFQTGKIPPASGRPLSSCWGSCTDPVTGLLHYKETNGGQGSAFPSAEPWGEEQGMDASPVHRASAVLPTCHRAMSSKARSTPLEGSPWHQSLQPSFYHPTLLQLSTTTPLVGWGPTPATGLASTCRRMLLPAFLGNSPFTAHLSILPGLADPRERECTQDYLTK